ncbi:MAG: chromosomal replication initiator protein DnaA [Hyphomicrobiales bacterium]|nr:chromosomal replication initiator protein DnaA [Hyphomicrobiales bacterium]
MRRAEAAKEENLSMDDGWKRVCRRLRAELGDAKFDSWFGRIELDRVDGRAAFLSVPTKFLKSWIQLHYLDRIRAICATEMPEVVEIDIRVRSSTRAPLRAPRNEAPVVRGGDRAASGGADEMKIPPRRHPTQSAETEDLNSLGGSPLDRRMTFDSFVVGESNKLAHAASQRIAKAAAGDPAEFNPLYLHSNVGLGKTHLIQAIAQGAEAAGRKVVYLTAEKFMYGFVASLKSHTAIAFKESLRSIDLLIIDDVQFLNGKIIQQEFGHVLNSLLDSTRQVVVAADRAPLELESLDERIKSRLGGGLCIELKSFDEQLRLSILESRVGLAKRKQPCFVVPDSVLRYVARTIDTNGRDLEGAVNRMLAHVTLTAAPLTVESTEAVIRDLVRSRDPKKVKIEDIQKLVANHYNVSRADLLSSRRTASVVRPRQIAMFLSKVLTPRSLPEIGRRFGGRDHTTVLHAVRKIEGLSSTDQSLAQDLEFLKRMLTEI